jgi:membrane protease YdiL (CAAX protease family)
VRTLALLGLVLGLLAITAVTSPWVVLALRALGFAFHFSRVYNRIFEILLVLVIVLGWRRLDLGSATQIGLRDPGWARDLARGLAIGVVGVGAGVLACWLGGAMVPQLRYDVAKTAGKAVAGVLGAVIVGIGEEAFFRGVLLRRFAGDLGRAGGVVLTTAIYAIVHALRPGGPHEPNPFAGIERTLALFAPLGRPEVVPSMIGLFGLGLILACRAPPHRQPVAVSRYPRRMGGGVPRRPPVPRHSPDTRVARRTRLAATRRGRQRSGRARRHRDPPARGALSPFAIARDGSRPYTCALTCGT